MKSLARKHNSLIEVKGRQLIFKHVRLNSHQRKSTSIYRRINYMTDKVGIEGTGRERDNYPHLGWKIIQRIDRLGRRTWNYWEGGVHDIRNIRMILENSALRDYIRLQKLFLELQKQMLSFNNRVYLERLRTGSIEPAA